MKRELVYMAHPVRPINGETLESNLHGARGWLRELLSEDTGCDVICPWLAEIDAFGGTAEAEQEQRTAGMARNVRIAQRCDGIILVGHRISEGMIAEKNAVEAAGGWFLDVTGFGTSWVKALLRRGRV